MYNTFPWPEPPGKGVRERIVEAAQAVLDERDRHPDATLADLYDPLTMPTELVAAHAGVDRAVDRLFGRGSFDEVKRLAALLRRYQMLTRVLTTPPARGRG